MVNRTFKALVFSVGVSALVFAGCAGTPAAAGPDELDAAIREASDYLDSNIPGGNKIVILNVQSNSDALSDYIIDELIANAVNDKNFLVVDRQQLDAIRSELDFQWAGEVDDNSAQEIGKMVGAQTIVSGAISKVGNNYRMRIRALEVQTAQVQGQFNRNIPGGETISALVNSESSGGGGSSGGSGTQTAQAGKSGSSGGGTQAKAPVAPAKIPNGTYTFFPRIQAYQGPGKVKAFIPMIKVRGEYVAIYVTGSATGPYSRPEGYWFVNYTDRSKMLLQDLDNPAKSYAPEPGAVLGIWSSDEDGDYYSFKGVTGRRLSFSNSQRDIPITFEEIVIGEPDAQ
ncbi:hypothetical protein AGMMS49587_05390 [Spirochaetia bacterium]|nr:hypothetical protein AGMMS49587_05390 [Spirochaetia bacterium]